MDNHDKDFFKEMLAALFRSQDALEDQIISHYPNAPGKDDNSLHEE